MENAVMTQRRRQKEREYDHIALEKGLIELVSPPPLLSLLSLSVPPPPPSPPSSCMYGTYQNQTDACWLILLSDMGFLVIYQMARRGRKALAVCSEEATQKGGAVGKEMLAASDAHSSLGTIEKRCWCSEKIYMWTWTFAAQSLLADEIEEEALVII